MQIRVNPTDPLPIYAQIVNQVKHLVASGRFTPGDEIPPIRVLAEELLVNPNTVARAYLELERAGIVNKRHGTGTYIAEPARPLPQRERIRILRERVDALLAEARHLSVPLADVLKLLRDRDAAMDRNTAR
jgi:GntR family transcriptional regulator